jgi:SAM-dependent methyltransferase
MAWNRCRIRIENGLIHDIAVPDDHFDVIIMDNSLEHTFDPNGALLKVFRLLRKGGGFFIAVPNSHGLSTKYLNANAHWGHWFLYSPRVLYDFLRSIGFVVTKVHALQESVNEAIMDRICDIERYREGLRTALVGEDAVVSQIGKVSVLSDYFHIMAMKRDGFGFPADRETELSRIAQASLEQLQFVSIL